MSDRKKGRGLDYTPRAFSGARAPDGPAPDLEDKLAKLGLVDRADAQAPRSDARSGVNADVNPGAKKRGGLEYTPQAFPGARAPDGPAPDLEDRLVAMGLAERTKAHDAQPDARHDANYAPPQPPARKDRPAAPPPAPPPISAQAPAARRERVEALAPPARASTAVSSAPASTPSRERAAAPSAPVYAAPPMAEAPRRAERAAPPEPEPTRRTERVSAPEPEVPRRTERAAPPPAPAPASPAFTATPQPVYVVPAPDTVASSGSRKPSQTLPAASPLPPVPPEAAPRPLPPVADPTCPALTRDIAAAATPAAKPLSRVARNVARLKKLPNKEERVRLSVRLLASVDEKLNDLVHLRGLDRNTAVSVAIVQDWVGCFGLQARQATR